MRQRLIPVLLLLSSVGATSIAYAQTQRSGGDSQRVMQQYQQLAGEKSALQAQLAQMQKDLSASQAETAAMKKERDLLKAHGGVPAATVKQLTDSKEAAEKNLETYKQRMSELISRFRETASNLKDIESDRTKVQKELSERNALFDKCVEDNLALYEINGEILDRYEHVGLFTKVSAGEPFTRITRTRIDNLVDEYRERATELRMKKTEGAAASGGQPGAGGAPVEPPRH